MSEKISLDSSVAITFFMVLVFRLFIGVYKAVLLKSRYCLDLVTGFVIFIRWQNSVFGTPL